MPPRKRKPKPPLARVAVKRKRLSKLSPARANPRVELVVGDPDRVALEASLDTFGYCVPMIWNKRTNRLVAGHQRLAILLDRGETAADVVVVDIPAKQEPAMVLAMNRVGGRWDEPALASVLAGLDTGPTAPPTGFHPDEIAALIAGTAAPAASVVEFTPAVHWRVLVETPDQAGRDKLAEELQARGLVVTVK